MSLQSTYQEIRKLTEKICKPLEIEDYVVQPVEDVSPPKWHLGHTTWFFETFILKNYVENYQEFNADYNFVFNSYYETIGARVIRTDRGNLSRPTVKNVYEYRKYVDDAMQNFFEHTSIDEEIEELLQLGFNHEQQHQELLWYDIKYILGHNPLFPAYADENIEQNLLSQPQPDWIRIEEGIYPIGYKGDNFCFDNELGYHKVYLQDFTISSSLVSNKEYQEFMDARAYTDFRFWHAEAWDWVKNNQINSPLYWHNIDGLWYNYTLKGLTLLEPDQPVLHVSYYEAAAFAAWKDLRLPTEFEWEVAAEKFSWGQAWEWTESAYLPYPGFSKAPGAIGEYNGKFMVNQKVLRGSSIATSPNHARKTYRNFFHPHLRWHYNGFRLAK